MTMGVIKWLLTSDLHYSDRPKDEYRFKLLSWLKKQQAHHDCTATFLLGDLTDQKDKHSATLVNRLVAEFVNLKPPVYALKGNHDFLADPANPFFKFLDNIEGLHFITDPKLVEGNVYMIPHQPNQAAFDEACARAPRGSYIMCHQTFEGAIGENNRRLAGLRASALALIKPRAVWAGDVHVPHQCGPVVYTGAPYHVRFGDVFTPRVILHDGAKSTDLHFPCLFKWVLTIRSADELLSNEELRKGDQVRLTVELAREEAVEWPNHKQRIVDVCKELGLEIYGIDLKVNSKSQARKRITKGVRSDKDTFDEFCLAERTPNNIKQVGSDFV